MKFLIFVLSLFLVLPIKAQLTDAQKATLDAIEAMNKKEEDNKPIKAYKKYWSNSIMTKVDFGQTSLTNWAQGGNNTVSMKGFIDGNANYKKDEMFWNNRLQLDYGFVYSADKPFIQKSDDRFYFESKWGFQAFKTLYMSAQYNFKSQFSNSWSYSTPSAPSDLTEEEKMDWEPSKKDWMNKRQLRSGILSPAYTNLALGLDYKTSNWLTVNFAPLTGGFVIVDDPRLRESYKMAMRKEYKGDETAIREKIAELKAAGKFKEAGEYFKSSRFEFGAQLKVDIKVNVNNNFNYSTQILLFSDYLDNPQNIRVNWDNRFDWKLAKYFSLTFTTNLIYDDKVIVRTPEDINGGLPGKQRIQFKESLLFGFVYTFSNKKS